MEKKINNVLFFNAGNGEQAVYRVLFTYYSDFYKKDYAVFYNEKDEKDLIAFSFDENKTLHELEFEDEYVELNGMLEKYDAEQADEAK